jgi:cell division protease FtsH
VAREIDEEVRNLIEAAHTEAWSILSEYREQLDALATALLERETLHRKDLETILAGVEKRPRITAFNDFGDRHPSDKPPVKTPGELAVERGEPWPPVQPAPVPVPNGAPPVEPNGYPGQPYGQPAPPAAGYPLPAAPTQAFPRQSGTHGSRPDYGAPAGWSAPGWPPRDEQQQTPQDQGSAWGRPEQQQPRHANDGFQPWGAQPQPPARDADPENKEWEGPNGRR